MTAPAATGFAPSLRVTADGVAVSSSGSFSFIVHRRAEPVAFLSTPLMALGSGDALRAFVEVAPGASVTVSGQGPAQLLKTARPVVQAWRFEIGAGAHATFLPWLTIPYPGSRSCATVEVELGPGASFVGWDVLAAGRVARGERFDLAELRAGWRIAGTAGVLLDERLLLRGDDREAASAMLAGRTHVGSVYAAGLAEAELPLSAARGLLGALELAGASRPAPELLLARALDISADRLEQGFWPVVSAARDAAGVPPLAPWHVARRWF